MGWAEAISIFEGGREVGVGGGGRKRIRRRVAGWVGDYIVIFFWGGGVWR